MTREEAVDRLKEARAGHKVYLSVEILNMAIEALQKEPCEDAISRDDALMALTGEWTDSTDELIHRFIRRIKTLPSVTPQPKTGHWIDDKCSACGKGIEDLIESSEWYENEEPNFCPFCGIKIQEVEDDNNT